MGNIVVAEPEAPLACGMCFTATPLYIYAYFSGIQICNPGDPVAPNRVIMKQDPGIACKWSGTRSDGWTATLEYTAAPFSGITLSKAGQQAFVGSSFVGCKTSFSNFLICMFPADVGWGGSCHLGWHIDPIPEFIADDMGFMPVVDSLFDKIGEAADKRTYRMTNPIGQTNVQIKVDTDEIPP